MGTVRRPFGAAALLAVTVAATGIAGRAAASCAPTATRSGAPWPGGEWRFYGHDLANTRSQDLETTIGPLEAATLAPAWAFSSNGGGDFTGTPIVADGCVYVGSNAGFVYALNADTGRLVWRAQVPAGGGINSSLAVPGDGRVYAAVSHAGRGACSGSQCEGPYLVAFDQATGALRWVSSWEREPGRFVDVIDAQPGADVYGSPMVFDGLVFEGVSGGAAELGDETDRYAFQGSFVILDAATGAVLRKTWTIHPPGRPKDAFAGAGIWSTPAIDPAARVAYVGTANPFQPRAEHPHADAVLKIDLDRRSPTFGQILAHYKGLVDEYLPVLGRLPCVDIPGNPPPYYPQGVGACGDLDLDFGAAPNLIRGPGGRLLVGAGQKSGIYHVFRADTMEGVWTSLVGPPSSVGGIVGSTAYDGRAIYGPITLGGYLWSITADRGRLRWLAPVADAVHWGNPVAYANGVVYTADLKGFLDAYDARSGLPLLHRPIALGAGTGPNPVLSWGGVSVARGTVYAAVGITGLATGFVVAFRPGALPAL
jgi:polyvinyl alcohol dehydrogenase (cytochrome)